MRLAGLVFGMVLAATPAAAHRAMPASPAQTPPDAVTPDSVQAGAWVIRPQPGEPGGAALSVGRWLGNVELGLDGEVRFPDQPAGGRSFELGLRGGWQRFFARAEHDRLPSGLDDRAVAGAGFGLGGVHGEVYGGWLSRDWDDPQRAPDAGPLAGLSLSTTPWAGTTLGLRAEGPAGGPNLALSTEYEGPAGLRLGLDLTVAEDPAQPHRLGGRVRWREGGALGLDLDVGWEQGEGAGLRLGGTLRF